MALAETARLEDDFGDFASALRANEEAIGLLRGLVGISPEATATLSSALTNFSATLSAVGSHERAAAAAEEAVTLAEEANQIDPERRKLLASALMNVGLAKMATGDGAVDALSSIEQAVHHFSEIETVDSSVAGPLANALNTLAVLLLARGRKAEALEHSARAVSVAARAAERVPGELPGFANSLNTYGSILKELNRLDEALAQCARAVEIYRHLSGQSSAYTRELSNALDELAEIERLRGNFANATANADEAARLNPNRGQDSESTIGE